MGIILKSCLILALLSVQFFVYTDIPEAEAQAQIVRDIIFPVVDTPDMNYRDDFGDPRAGHTHEGNDVFAPKMTPLVAVTDGTIRRVNYPEASWGQAVILRDSDGYSYWYLHMNNDTPGTDNGEGGAMYAYAPYIDNGTEVVQGQLIGWMGDSGNAEATPSHLHFEIHPPGGGVINPYYSLRGAQKIRTPVKPPELNDELLPFGEFTGGTSIDYGNFDSSSRHEVVAGAGPDGAPHVKVLRSSGRTIGAFYAYDENFRGGIDVAAGDLDGDGIDEIITAPGPGGGPHIKIFDKDGESYSTEGFFAYTPSFRGGVNITTADIDNDGKDEIITGAGPGGGPHVRIFKGDGTPLGDGFFAYDAEFRGGVDVAATDATSSEEGSIITGAGPGGGPHVRVFNTEGLVQDAFYAYDESFLGGVRVSAGPINPSSSSSLFSHFDFRRDDSNDEDSKTTSAKGREQILTAPARDGGPDIRIYNLDGSLVEKGQAFERWWQGGYDVAVGNGITFVSNTDSSLSYLGSRRASIQEGPK